MLFAAIDIGSNAVRLLFSNVNESKGVVHNNKASLIRTPVRLGTEVFQNGEISPELKEDLIKTLQAYKLLIEVAKVKDYMACATSALREARNGPEIVAEVRKRTGLNLQLIDGDTEAELIFSTHKAEEIDHNKSYLYIDVGGGSTELTLFYKGIHKASQSFRIGTIRQLENLVDPAEWERLQEWLKVNTSRLKDLSAIGTGGNINKLYKISGRKGGKPMYQATLSHYLKHLGSFTLQERIDELGMRPDRADVIIPATEIYLQILKWAGIHDLYVPKVGLADGMIYKLWEKYQRELESEG